MNMFISMYRNKYLWLVRVEHTEVVMRQEAERQKMQKELQDHKALVCQLLAKNGITFPPCNNPNASDSNLP